MTQMTKTACKEAQLIYLKAIELLYKEKGETEVVIQQLIQTNYDRECKRKVPPITKRSSSFVFDTVDDLSPIFPIDQRPRN